MKMRYDDAILTFHNLPSERKAVYAELLAGESLPVIDFDSGDMQTISAGRADIPAGRVVEQTEMQGIVSKFR